MCWVTAARLIDLGVDVRKAHDGGWWVPDEVVELQRQIVGYVSDSRAWVLAVKAASDPETARQIMAALHSGEVLPR